MRQTEDVRESAVGAGLPFGEPLFQARFRVHPVGTGCGWAHIDSVTNGELRQRDATSSIRHRQNPDAFCVEDCRRVPSSYR